MSINININLNDLRIRSFNVIINDLERLHQIDDEDYEDDDFAISDKQILDIEKRRIMLQRQGRI